MISGENVKVHITNLTEPDAFLQIRTLNEDHVSNMAAKIERSYDPFTILIGILDDNCNVADLERPDQTKIQVLGGNHTRAALQLLHERGSTRDDTKYVRMDLYHGLTNQQALFLAYSHNEMHEHSRQMSFEEKVNFFHNLRERTAANNPKLTQRDLASAWREQIATLQNL